MNISKPKIDQQGGHRQRLRDQIIIGGNKHTSFANRVII